MTTVVRPTGPLNKTRLAEAVALQLGVSNEDGIRAVEAVLNVIARTVAGGHSVTVTNFGSWIPKHRPASTRRNPQNGDPVPVPAHTRLFFRLSDRLAAAVRAQDPAAADITKLPKGSLR
ncbi:HU family DNA-binding protein [Streptomyces sp. NPDC050388]|uniref:HU family DNA-binding protein n=1 Tax=Streptomyces sp. NPDC050388 TaxID=3155781 RepID=UPI0034282FE0